MQNTIQAIYQRHILFNTPNSELQKRFIANLVRSYVPDAHLTFLEEDIQYLNNKTEDFFEKNDCQSLWDIKLLIEKRFSNQLVLGRTFFSLSESKIAAVPELSTEEVALFLNYNANYSKFLSFKFDDLKNLFFLDSKESQEKYMMNSFKYIHQTASLKNQNKDQIRKALLFRLQYPYEGFRALEKDDFFFLSAIVVGNILDAHSRISLYFDEEETKAFNVQPVGFGLVLDFSENIPKVSSILNQSPAALSGKIQAGDRVTALTREYGGFQKTLLTKNRFNVQIRRWMQAYVDEEVTFHCIRPSQNNKYFTVKLKATELKSFERVQSLKMEKQTEIIPPVNSTSTVNVNQQPNKSVTVETVITSSQNIVHHLKLKHFDSDSVKKINHIFGVIQVLGAHCVILDIRGNPGGFISALNEIFSILLDDNNKLFYSGPLVIVTDSFTASASESMVGSSQILQRALVIGDSKTIGKGTTQILETVQIGLSWWNDSLVNTTITGNYYFLPNGKNIQKEGVVPDIVIPFFQNRATYLESDLPYALKQHVPISMNKEISNFLKDYKKNSKYRLMTPEIIEDLKNKSEKRCQQLYGNDGWGLTLEEEILRIADDLALKLR
ncbi:MAG: hypothetical protein HYS98_01255 [Deltaproteobacteria bacterium]|nr:hypothetical protein [Deltaproteobacteria bacterium]